MVKPNILFIEDEAALAKFVKLELEYEGYEVTIAPEGLSGLSTAREKSPDLILLDWMLPGISGLEICRRLRQTGDKVPLLC